MKRNDHHIFALSNGMRVAYQHVPTSKIVHCGIFLDVGSRDEEYANQGIAHFWEHMAFKGTGKRKAFHIINSLDSVGGELNAYTDKEKVVFYASVRNQYVERAVDLLSDITFNSIFPEHQIEKERGVIMEEMSMYFDNPDDSLQDEFESVIYKNHPMGMNILGRPETVQRFHRKDFMRFYKQNLDTRKIVFSCVGNVTRDQVELLAKKYLEIKPVKRTLRRKKFKLYQPHGIELQRDVKQARCAIGRDAYAIHHENRFPFYLLVNLLGGPGMNSRLNLALREKHGYVYSVDAHYVSYSDTGMFAVFFGTEPRQLDKCIKVIRKELDRLMENPLSSRQLNAVKEQVTGQLAMAEEHNQNVMMMMGRSLLDLKRIPSQEEIFQKIEQVASQGCCM
jgi:predicted Zn-dependent peptidase